jgi:hypothetical protein
VAGRQQTVHSMSTLYCIQAASLPLQSCENFKSVGIEQCWHELTLSQRVIFRCSAKTYHSMFLDDPDIYLESEGNIQMLCKDISLNVSR